MKRVRHEHDRQSTRLQSWDYSRPAWYFVTVVVKDRRCLFGKIVNDEMRLNEPGRIVEEEWLRTPTIRPNVELDAYVIMPNHVHGIVIINDSKEPHRRGVSQYAPTESSFRSASQTLGAIIRGFKGSSTRRINLLRSTPSSPVWQRNFYDHIIRNEADLHRIRAYISNNPLRWAIDEENPANEVQ